MAAKLTIFGVYRIQRAPPLENEVWVLVDGRSGRFIPESDYRAQGLGPPAYALPWEDEYKADQERERRRSGVN